MTHLVIRHNRQQGTLVFGATFAARRVSESLTEWPCTFRPSKYLPDDEDLGEAYWYLPNSRRHRANTWKIETAQHRLIEAGNTIAVDIDSVTPAVGFAEHMQDKYDRAANRANYREYRARKNMWTHEHIMSENRTTYDALAGTPVLLDHYSAPRHLRLLDRLWKREGRAWQLYHDAKELFALAQSAAQFQTHTEHTGTTRRRIERLEAELRSTIRGIDSGKYNGVALLIERADMFERLEEIDYWHKVLEHSGAKLWCRDDFERGDFVSFRVGVWHEVVRVNSKSLSVQGRYDVGVKVFRALPGELAQPIEYSKVLDKLPAVEINQRFPFSH
ncbi:DUF3560 domain-containing protein [Nocardia sp. NPDC051052]|uniref:DUF3560 domain-containing protein n=1 Tax=Nocardia sp. NPDC051052 TaxID=3364322 RepID=UPI00378BEA93